jgi:hypothetical protein
MKSVRHSPRLMLVGIFCILTAVIFLALQLLVPVVRTGGNNLPVSMVYVAKSNLSVGSPIQGNVKLVEVSLPQASLEGYLTAADYKTFEGDTTLIALQAGQLISTIELTGVASNSNADVPLSFKVAPPLAVGDLVDIYIVEPNSTGGSSLVSLLTGIPLLSGSGSSWVVAVPMAIAPSLLYVASNDQLDALQVRGTGGVSSPPINSNAQAIATIQHGGS